MIRGIILIIVFGCIIACNAHDAKHTTTDSATTSQALTDTVKDSIPDTALQIFPPPGISVKKVGYILDFRSPAAIPLIRYKQCNVMIFAFAYINSKGLYLRYEDNLKGVSKKANEAGCKLLLGISASHAMFRHVTATQQRRTALVKQVMAAIKKYELDGADIDWEFPSIKDKTNEAFTLFLKQLSDSCHVNGNYYLSCAISPGVNGGKRSSAINSELLTGTWVDWFNVMVYDDFSEVHPYHHHSDINTAITSFKYWLRVRGIKKEKCVMGLPLYGRPSGIKQQGRIKTYAAILQAGGSPYKDSAVIKIDTTKVKDSLTQYTIYYDGIKTIRKKAIGGVQYGGGIMFWETGQDVNTKYSLIKAGVEAADAEAKKEKEKGTLK